MTKEGDLTQAGRFKRRSATQYCCARLIRGLKPTVTVTKSLRDCKKLRCVRQPPESDFDRADVDQVQVGGPVRAIQATTRS